MIVDDFASDASLIEFELQQAGYALVTRQVETAGELCAALDAFAVDLIVCDDTVGPVRPGSPWSKRTPERAVLCRLRQHW